VNAPQSLDHVRPFHVAVFDMVRAYLATRRIELAALREEGGRTAGTFEHAGKRYVVTVAEESSP
jgi:hypothetical protein